MPAPSVNAVTLDKVGDFSELHSSYMKETKHTCRKVISRPRSASAAAVFTVVTGTEDPGVILIIFLNRIAAALAEFL